MLKHVVCSLFGLVVSCGFAAAQSAPISDRDTQPITLPHPYYPKLAIDIGLSGTCDVMLDVDAMGKTSNVRAICSDIIFKDSAESSMQDVEFVPKIVDGKRVPRTGVIYPLEYRIG